MMPDIIRLPALTHSVRKHRIRPFKRRTVIKQHRHERNPEFLQQIKQLVQLSEKAFPLKVPGMKRHKHSHTVKPCFPLKLQFFFHRRKNLFPCIVLPQLRIMQGDCRDIITAHQPRTLLIPRIDFFLTPSVPHPLFSFRPFPNRSFIRAQHKLRPPLLPLIIADNQFCSLPGHFLRKPP